ncbi:hypothetical protein, partial [Actinomyces sp. MRS3W]|uniref:hypothetical protein n=1 Tax=Actinomyces sp. MRS3W TaxID=2800796 RepID=UPI0028FD9813
MNPDRGKPLAVFVAAAAAVLLIVVGITVMRDPSGLGDEPGIAMTPATTDPAEAARSAGPLMSPSPSPTDDSDADDDTDDDAPA